MARKLKPAKEKLSSRGKSKASKIKSGRSANRFAKTKGFLARGKKKFQMPLPDNRLGRLMGKRIRIVPGFIGNAWLEIRQVTWPSRKETFKLALAVFIFSTVFGSFVAAVDYGLDKLFKEVIFR